MDNASESGHVLQDENLLLQFIYQCPVGLAEVDNTGAIHLLNALGVALLMPMGAEGGLGNFFDLLRPVAPDLVHLIETSTADREICRGWPVRVEPGPRHLAVTALRLDANTLMIAFLDVTTTVEAEHIAREALASQALQAGRAEMAATVLHDIGNAITGIGTRSVTLLAEPEWPECDNLARLSALLRSKAAQLASAFGDSKATAMIGLTAALDHSLRRRQVDLRAHVVSLATSVSHVQDILAVQRQYVNQNGQTPRSRIGLGELVSDAMAIMATGLEKRAVQVVRRVPADLPRLRLDRTRVVQVLVNLIRNACESFDSAADEKKSRCLEISAESETPGWVRLRVKDNAAGFSPEQGETLFERGRTTKTQGSGLGLYSSRSTVESHGGHMTIVSEGPEKGATVTLHFPSAQEDKQIA